MAFGLRAAFMILLAESVPFETVARSFVAPKQTVVLNKVTFSTIQPDEPSRLTSDSEFET